MLHRLRKNPQSWRCSCIFGQRFLTVPTLWAFQVGTAAETESDPPQKNHFETFFSFFFHILPIAKWFGSQVSAIVVQFLLRSSFFKLFSQKFWYFTDKNQNTTVWATGRMVSLGSCHILFLQLNWHSYSMGSNPIDAVINLFWHEFILFWSFSCEVIQISLFHVQWSLWSLGNIYLALEWMSN